MNKKFDVLTFGDICVDLILSGSNMVPEFGQKEKLVDDYSLEMGGSCTIFACQTAKLGLRTVVAGKTGDDRFGDMVRSTLADAGVSLEYLAKSCGSKTGVSVILNAGEDRAILTYNGTIDVLGLRDIDEELLGLVRHLHIGSYFLMKKLQPAYPEIIRKLKSYGATISLDTNWDPEEKWDSGIREILPYVDMIFPNENEAMAITGENSADKAIMKLSKIIPIVAVKKGKDGVVTYSGQQIVYTPAIDVIKVDAVGAGDSFDGGFVYGYLTGRSIEDCARIGCICGSLNTRASGGTRGQPGIEEMLGYLKK